ncbi:TetR family transcriptional regulator [Scytonema hofmannii PCC 7110]|uniref:TetR family transcriptional regulator n=1 Tax=Scytonema hofmannii PCC 7110 TaxID=128403 RepID=A0A139WRK3_9CYAN|nr:TetR/AcrR family transcriptional regulator [Scytonema hofmannii]KYC35062.1 TetR family transcriptional regulator [Scytonema hofmannii PCC 7110]
MRETEDHNPDRKLSEEKVEAILSGAIQEFLANGYAATTMDRVTAAAGVSKATIYNYFQDKEGLFTALIQQLIIKRYQAAFNPQKALSAEGEASDILRQLAISILESVTKDERVLGLIRLVIGESGRFPELARTFIRNIEKPALDDLSQFLSCCELNLPDPDASARIFLGTLVHFILVQEIFHGSDILPMERNRLIDNLVDLFTAKLTAKPLSSDRFTGTRQKSQRRNRQDSGKFERDYSEPKRLRSIRLTDTAWENLAAIAAKDRLTRSEVIEIIARNEDVL